MTRYDVTIRNKADRERASRMLAAAPYGVRLSFKGEKRSLPQNDKMWAMLTEVAQQLRWHGVILRPDDWKLIFLDALKRELRMVPNLDNTGFVNLGRSSSDLSKEEMGDLITLIIAFGEDHGVVFSDTDIQESSQSLRSPSRTETKPATVNPTPSPVAGTYSREVA